jgi:hypothetical protein
MALKIELLNSNKIINDNAIVLNVKSMGVNGKFKFFAATIYYFLYFTFTFLLLF